MLGKSCTELFLECSIETFVPTFTSMSNIMKYNYTKMCYKGSCFLFWKIILPQS